jgi:pimeloyl-ACP methyl ester carboxylesterase
MNRTATLLALLVLLVGCASREPLDPAYFEIEPGRLPVADVSLQIPGLGPCTDNPDRTLRLNASQPVNVLVHGCFGSSGQFRGLAQVLAFHGQQTACFTYDDRAAHTFSATELRGAVNQLAALPEQRNARVETDPRARRIAARAGHVEIVGDKRVSPLKLISILQAEGVLHATAPERLSALSQLLARVYRDDAL